VIRETVVYPHVLHQIMHEVREDEGNSRLMEGLGAAQTR
jgi:hypothetical protein